MTNFHFLRSTPDFSSFAPVAISAEYLLHIDPNACVLNCRRAMEFAVKWMYAVDRELQAPEDGTLAELMNQRKFRDIIGKTTWRRMDLIRRLGNNVAHGEQTVTPAQAELCLEHLFVFMDTVAYLYAPDYQERKFDKSLLELTVAEALSFVSDDHAGVQQLVADDPSLREAVRVRREARK